MGMLSTIQAHKDDILRIAERHRAGDVRVFGSTARGEDGSDSDVDLLVRWNDGASLTDWVAFQQEVEALLGRHVDVVSESGLHWYIRDKVLAEARALE